MSKYELSLTKDYVPGWGLTDAIRELFQNALDQEKQQPGNFMFHDYVPSTQILQLGNEKSVLEARSLLLGSSSKANDPDTIGQFGEGYKVATLVLTRLGKKVTFYNFGKQEIWRPRFVKSRKYGTEILTFFTEKSYFRKLRHEDLIIQIEGITQEEYEEIKETNLHLQDRPLEDLPGACGSILRNPHYKGKVYVNGLYVCDYDKYHYGYNFHPDAIKLDRDRKLVSDFHLDWLASKMWLNQTTGDVAKLVASLSAQGAADVKYVTQMFVTGDNILKEAAKEAHKTFKKEYGEKAVPVTTQSEAESLATGYKPVIVKEEYKQLISSSAEYEKPVYVTRESYASRLTTWYESIDLDTTLSSEQLREFEAIVKEMEEEGL
jgi:hypothetical protein